MRRTRWAALGPAFVAAVAYVDPGNFAANFSAGAEFGYLLLWVLVGSCIVAMFVQFTAAKVGFVTGRSLSQLVGERVGPRMRWAYGAQATLVVIATEIAEVIGGAIGLYLLFGIPVVWGGVMTGIASLLLLELHERLGQQWFERAIMGSLLIVPLGFIAGLVLRPPLVDDLLAGLMPRLAGFDSVVLAVAMLGATVMPHVIYLHTGLARDRFGRASDHDVPGLIRATKVDVGLALALAGSINVSMLVLASAAMPGRSGADTLEGIHAGLSAQIAPWVGLLFAIGLTVSGIASTAVGGHSGANVLEGLGRRRETDPPALGVVPRRLMVIVPAVALLAVVPNSTTLLVLSQTVLAFGIPFALVPLVALASSRRVMGQWRLGPMMRVWMWAVALVIVVVDALLLVAPLLGVAA